MKVSLINSDLFVHILRDKIRREYRVTLTSLATALGLSISSDSLKVVNIIQAPNRIDLVFKEESPELFLRIIPVEVCREQTNIRELVVKINAKELTKIITEHDDFLFRHTDYGTFWDNF